MSEKKRKRDSEEISERPAKNLKSALKGSQGQNVKVKFLKNRSGLSPVVGTFISDNLMIMAFTDLFQYQVPVLWLQRI